MTKKKKKLRVKAQEKLNSVDFTIYTDGGCLVNPGGQGGYGVVMINNSTREVRELSGGYISTTNNRMEIMAALRNYERETPSALALG